MRPELLDTILCPGCGKRATFAPIIEKQNESEIREGSVVCASCSASYPIRAGVLDLLPIEAMREDVAKEVQGWDAAHENWFDLTGKKDNFWLIEPDNKETEGISSDEFMRRVPFYENICKVMYNEQHPRVEAVFQLFEAAPMTGKERVLDLGAARCWTTREFAKWGCRCVAVDITTTKYIGLESSDVYFEQNPGLYWERVRCDMESLPFAEGSFDVIFCAAVLHHTKDPLTVIRNLHRILAPGGRVLVVNEPDYGWLDKREVMKALEHEASNGVNENLYNYHMFRKYFRQAGFTTNFFSPINSAKYNGYRARLFLERMGLKLDPVKTQEWIGNQIMKHHHYVRYIVGLGTMGIATKRD